MAMSWQAVSVLAAKPYLKALALVTTLMIVWFGLCTS